MGDESSNQPDRIDVDLPIPVPVGGPAGVVQLTGISFDDVNQAQTPSDLVAAPGEAGVRTEWDAASLDSSIQWLEAHGEFLNRMATNMADIQDLMGGPSAGMAPSGMGGTPNPLGGFPWAQRLASKHNSLYTTTESSVRQLAERLYDAADVLRKVKENYETAEGANAMTAADMQQVFSDVAGSGGNGQPGVAGG